eukprot:TRINITY_DN10327_c0_g1_i1.p1 TRINITY_DN10327_c0_g1~~TRINITY_DN10327_c0_g1_i1.p1  ORF type:complete len:143 (+),score=23.84 TRINITY_DN10327_c0_g1_i1:123-551(+)
MHSSVLALVLLAIVCFAQQNFPQRFQQGGFQQQPGSFQQGSGFQQQGLSSQQQNPKSCQSNGQCNAGFLCIQSKCVENMPSCQTNLQCLRGFNCVQGFCTPSSCKSDQDCGSTSSSTPSLATCKYGMCVDKCDQSTNCMFSQ